MKNKIIIIGKNSFVGKNLYIYFKGKTVINIISFNQFKKKKNFSQIDYIINCSSTLNYINKKYKSKNDIDLKISKKIKKFKNCKLIFLSTRKVYKPSDNISENGKILLRENYSKNKYITESKLKNILYNRVLILRVSNLIGLSTIKSERKLHKTFIDHYIENIEKNTIFHNNKLYKDFISIKVFAKIVFLLIKKKKTGVFNVSLGRKVYLTNIINWLNFYNPNKRLIKKLANSSDKKYNKDSFYLNNHKLLKAVKIDINLNDLKKECLRISKKLFYEKKK